MYNQYEDSHWHEMYLQEKRKREKLEDKVLTLPPSMLDADIAKQEKEKALQKEIKESTQFIHTSTFLAALIVNGFVDPIIFANSYPHWIIPTICGAISVTFAFGGIIYITLRIMMHDYIEKRFK